jgi:hypothetical protein
MKAGLGAASCRKWRRTYVDASEKALRQQRRERRRCQNNPQVQSTLTTRRARTPLTGNERGDAYQVLCLVCGPQHTQGFGSRTAGYQGSPLSRSARSLKKSGLPAISVRAVQLSLPLLPPARIISNLSPQYAARGRPADQRG